MAETIAKTAQPYLKTSIASSGGYTGGVGGYSSTDIPTSHVGGTWKPPQIYSSSVADTNTSISIPGGNEAKNLVNELCLVNAARTSPSQQALDNFVRKAESIDGECLGQSIIAKLNDSSIPWIHKMKVLWGIEALHVAGLDAVTGTIKEVGSVALLGLLSSPQCGVKARNVCEILGMIDSLTSQEVTKSATPPMARNITTEDLLDFGNEPVVDSTTDLLIDTDPVPANKPSEDLLVQMSPTNSSKHGLNDSLI
jgi:hypothetical protein